MLLDKLVIPIDLDTGLVLEGLDLLKQGITGVIDQVTNAIDTTLSWGDELDNIQDSMGGTAQQAAGLDLAMKKIGLDTSTGLTMWNKFTKGLKDAKGNFGTTGKLIQTLGINLYNANGSMKDASSLMGEVATKINAMPDGLEKSNIEMQLFGRSGVEAGDLMAQLANGGMQAVIDQASALGLATDPTKVKAYEAAWSTLQATFQGLQVTFGEKLLPSLTALFDVFQNWLASPWIQNSLAGIGTELGTLIDDVTVGLQTGNWDKLFSDLDNLWEGILRPKIVNALNQAIAWAQDPNNITGFLNTLIDGLTGAGETPTSTDPSIIGLVGQLIEAIAIAIGNANWSKVGDALKNGFNDQIKNLNITSLPAWALVGAGILISVQLFNLLISTLSILGTIMAAIAGSSGGMTVLTIGLRAMALIITEMLIPLALNPLTWLIASLIVLVVLLVQHWGELGERINQIASIILHGGIFELWREEIQALVDWVFRLADSLSRLRLPSWLTPGSPTPLENGLRGINSAMSDLNGKAMVEFSGHMSGMSNQAPLSSGIDYDRLGRVVGYELAKVLG